MGVLHEFSGVGFHELAFIHAALSDMLRTYFRSRKRGKVFSHARQE
jgi:hypothetical protein